MKSPKPFFKPGFRTSFPLIKVIIFRKFGFLSVKKMTPEKVRLIKNSKQEKFRGFCGLPVTFKINSHKSY